ARQRQVLGVFVGQVIGSFKLDPDREIVAVGARPPGRIAGMPGAKCAGYELRQGSLATDQKMRRDAQIRNGSKVGMRLRVEAIGEQLDDPWPSELAGGQRNIMYHQQSDIR